MSFDKAVEEIKMIVFRHLDDNEFAIGFLKHNTELDKDLSDFLKRFEEGSIQEFKDDNLDADTDNEPMFDKNDLD